MAPWQVRTPWLPEVRGRTTTWGRLGRAAVPCLPSENNSSENLIGGSVRECWGTGVVADLGLKFCGQAGL